MPDARDRPRVWPWALLLALLAFSLWGCDLDLSPLLSAEERAQGLARLATLLGSFWPPKLTGDYLLVCAGLTLDTAATATLGAAKPATPATTPPARPPTTWPVAQAMLERPAAKPWCR